MHAIYLLFTFAVTVLMAFNEHGNYLRHTAVCRAPTSYTRTITTTIEHSDNTDGTTGTCNGSPTPYVPILSSSAIKIPSFD